MQSQYTFIQEGKLESKKNGHEESPKRVHSSQKILEKERKYIRKCESFQNHRITEC